MKQGYIIHSERDCVHTCSNCNGRIELFYPDGTEVVTLPYCPYCGCSLGEKSEVNIPFMTSPIGDLPINSEGLRKAIDKMVELSVNRDGWRNRAWDAEKELSQLKNKMQNPSEHRITKRGEHKTIFTFSGSIQDFRVYKQLQGIEDRMEDGEIVALPKPRWAIVQSAVDHSLSVKKLIPVAKFDELNDKWIFDYKDVNPWYQIIKEEFDTEKEANLKLKEMQHE